METGSELRKYHTDHLADKDMHDFVEDLYKRASEFMHQGGLRMDENFVGKPQDIYLWCFICKSKTAGGRGCLMLFTAGCCAGIRITDSEKGKHLTSEFCGAHHLCCHDALLMKGTMQCLGSPGLGPI